MSTNCSKLAKNDVSRIRDCSGLHRNFAFFPNYHAKGTVHFLPFINANIFIVM
jgi:hypothetical protein